MKSEWYVVCGIEGGLRAVEDGNRSSRERYEEGTEQKKVRLTGE
jgi:hypothetical protein